MLEQCSNRAFQLVRGGTRGAGQRPSSLNGSILVIAVGVRPKLCIALPESGQVHREHDETHRTYNTLNSGPAETKPANIVGVIEVL